MGPPWGLLGASWGLVAPLGGLWGPPRRLLGPKARNLNLVFLFGTPIEPVQKLSRAVSSRLGGLPGRLGPLFGRLGALLGASWAVLGISWADLDAVKAQEANMLKMYVLQKEWGYFCLSGPSWGASWVPLGASWGASGLSRCHLGLSWSSRGALLGASRAKRRLSWAVLEKSPPFWDPERSPGEVHGPGGPERTREVPARGPRAGISHICILEPRARFARA